MLSLEILNDTLRDVCKYIGSTKDIIALATCSRELNKFVKQYHAMLTSATLDLDYDNYESTIKFLSYFSPRLKDLTISGGHKSNSELQRVVSMAAKRLGKSLESINRSGQSTNFNSLTRSTSKTLSCHALRLKRLDGWVLNDLDDEHLIALTKSCPNLQNLNFSRLENLNLLYPNVSSWGIRVATGYLSQLSEIDFSFCSIDDEMIDLVAKSTASRLKHIHLMGCWTLTSGAIQSIARYCKELESISLFEMDSATDESIIALSRGCKKLIALDLGSCIDLSDNAFIFGVSKLQYLRDLSVFHCRITDNGLKALSKGCPQLTALDLTSCRGLNPKNIMNILHCASWTSNIEEIDFSELLIDDCTIWIALHTFPSLNTLRLANCPNLTEKTIKYISNARRHRMESLTIKQEERISTSPVTSASLPTNSVGSLTIDDLNSFSKADSEGEASLLLQMHAIKMTLPTQRLKAIDLSCCCGIPDVEKLITLQGLEDLIMTEV